MKIGSVPKMSATVEAVVKCERVDEAELVEEEHDRRAGEHGEVAAARSAASARAEREHAQKIAAATA